MSSSWEAMVYTITSILRQFVLNFDNMIRMLSACCSNMRCLSPFPLHPVPYLAFISSSSPSTLPLCPRPHLSLFPLALISPSSPSPSSLSFPPRPRLSFSLLCLHVPGWKAHTGIRVSGRSYLGVGESSGGQRALSLCAGSVYYHFSSLLTHSHLFASSICFLSSFRRLPISRIIIVAGFWSKSHLIAVACDPLLLELLQPV